MTLSEYIKSYPRHQRSFIREQIAKELNVSEVYIRSMCNKNKVIPAKYALRIEKITNGAVSRHIIAPHYYPSE